MHSKTVKTAIGLLAIIVICLAVLLGYWLAKSGQGKTAATATASTPVATQSVKKTANSEREACDVRNGSMTPAQDYGNLTKVSDDVLVPGWQSDTDGFTKVSKSEVPYCYAHSATGAMLAAVNALYYQQTTGARWMSRNQVTGTHKQEIINFVRSLSQKELIQGTQQDQPLIRGVDVKPQNDHTVTVRIWFENNLGQVVQTYRMVWVGDDWMWDAPAPQDHSDTTDFNPDEEAQFKPLGGTD